MTTPELTPKDVKAYALYFLASFAPFYLAAIALQFAGAPASLAQLGQGVAWGYGLWNLTNRFFAGQRRVASQGEATGLAVRASVYTAIACTFMQVVAASFIDGVAVFDAPHILALGTLVSVALNFITLRVFLLASIQNMVFQRWSERNR